jgi:hypothetical protein
MAAFVAAIHTPWCFSECMDGRDKPGHDVFICGRLFINVRARISSHRALNSARLRKLADLYDLIVIAAWWKVVMHYLRDFHAK